MHKIRTYFLIPLQNIINFIVSVESIDFIQKVKLIISGLLNIFFQKKVIKFYNNNLYYDNLYNSINIINYPLEIEELKKLLDFSDFKNIIDIGANIGAFSYVLKSKFPNLNIYSIEPNQDIFPLLERNSTQFSNWKVYNFAIGEDNKDLPFYYIKNKSAQGSFFKDIASLNLTGELVIQPTTTLALNLKNTKSLQIPQQVDFIKIDTEGFEEIVINNLEIPTKYLYFEYTFDKQNQAKISNLLQVLENRFGNYEVLFNNLREGLVGEILIKFTK